MTLEESADGGTSLTYDADAIVGGMIGGVGQRMLVGVSKRMAAEFFGNVDDVAASGAVRAAVPADGGGPNHPRRFAPRPAGPDRAASTALRPRPAGGSSPGSGLRGAGCPAGAAWAGPVVRAGGGRGRPRHALAGTCVGAWIARRRTGDDATSTATARRGRWRPRSRAKEISARELLELHLARIARGQPGRQRGRLARRGAGPGRRRRGRRAAGPRRAGRAAARAAARVQGHPRGRRLAHDVRVAAARRLRAQARRARRRADPRRRRRTDRQDQRARVGGRVAHLQPGLRHHPQPVRPDPVGGRVERRRGGGARQRDGAARRRQRHGRLAAQPRVVQQRRRPAAQRRAGPELADHQRLGADLGRRPDGAQRRGPRVPALGDGRPVPPGAAVAGGTRLDVRAAAAGTATWPAYASRSRSTSAARSRSTTPSPT